MQKETIVAGEKKSGSKIKVVRFLPGLPRLFCSCRFTASQIYQFKHELKGASCTREMSFWNEIRNDCKVPQLHRATHNMSFLSGYQVIKFQDPTWQIWCCTLVLTDEGGIRNISGKSESSVRCFVSMRQNELGDLVNVLLFGVIKKHWALGSKF